VKYKLQDIIERNWHGLDRGRKPDAIQFILINKVFLVFKDKEKVPFIAIKFSQNNSLKQEFNNLTNINKLLPDETPKPYFYQKAGDYFLLGQGFHVGKNMSTIEITGKELNIILNCLIKFHKVVYKTVFYLDKKHLNEMVVKPFSHFLKINPSKLVEIELSQLLDRINQIKDYPLPYIPQHCDFSLVNLIFNHKSKSIYIIDWADFGKSYLPLYDIFLLIISNYLIPEKFPGLLGENQVNNIFIDYLRAYLKHFEIDERWVQTLFLIALITFFNQNYPHRMETSKTVKQLITFSLENKDQLFFNKLL